MGPLETPARKGAFCLIRRRRGGQYALLEPPRRRSDVHRLSREPLKCQRLDAQCGGRRQAYAAPLRGAHSPCAIRLQLCDLTDHRCAPSAAPSGRSDGCLGELLPATGAAHRATSAAIAERCSTPPAGRCAVSTKCARSSHALVERSQLPAGSPPKCARLAPLLRSRSATCSLLSRAA